MKKIGKLILTLVLVTIYSCSTEDANDSLNQQNLNPEINQKSSCGFGLFPNQEYDCGFQRGYSDWVYHYNTTVRNYNYDPCEEIRIVTPNGTVGIAAGKTNASSNIIQITQNNNQGYYNDLFDDLSTEFLKGKAAGYSFGRGQEPLSLPGDPDCTNGLGDGIF
ncbi:hypothetical protein [uncultured Aquimarina sp.]|uniref:hypothetical protein n=1 Tax=uncultured Aquimarina sp. TaxID=575652 RepID=UPI00262172AD|nr:hypothetical protein [uncultured Aquimarina sp.]